MHLSGAISEANADSERSFARRIVDAIGGLAGKRIAFLGLAFKADTDDVRSFPSVRLAARLLDGGAELRAHDRGRCERPECAHRSGSPADGPTRRYVERTLR